MISNIGNSKTHGGNSMVNNFLSEDSWRKYKSNTEIHISNKEKLCREKVNSVRLLRRQI